MLLRKKYCKMTGCYSTVTDIIGIVTESIQQFSVKLHNRYTEKTNIIHLLRFSRVRKSHCYEIET